MLVPSLLGICSFISPQTTYEQDVALAAKWGYAGLSVGEHKLDDPSLDDRRVSTLAEAGLRASAVIPFNISPLPVTPSYGVFSDAQDSDMLIAQMLGSVQRLAKFKPDSVVLITGARVGEDLAKQRAVAVEGLREAAKAAAKEGIGISLEPTRQDGFSIVHTLPDAIELLEEIGESNVTVAWDVWHLWDTPDIIAMAERYAKHVGTVHVCDWLSDPPQPGDRGFAGEGVADVPGLFAALKRGGYNGWYDVEVFHSAFQSTPPEEIFRRGRETFDRVRLSAAALV